MKKDYTAMVLGRLASYVSLYGLGGVFTAVSQTIKNIVLSSQTLFKIRLPSGTIVFLRARTSDLATFREIFLEGEYSLDRTSVGAILKKRYNFLVKNGVAPLILDAGGNIGLATCYLSLLFPDADFVIAEALKSNCDIIEMNTRSVSRVHIVHCALWGSSSELTFIQGNTMATGRTNVGHLDEGVRIPVKTFSSLLGENVTRCMIIKMDIEGAEANVFQTFEAQVEALTVKPAILIEPHDGIFSDFGSLSDLLGIDDYRNGMVVPHSNSLFLVPISFLESIKNLEL